MCVCVCVVLPGSVYVCVRFFERRIGVSSSACEVFRGSGSPLPLCLACKRTASSSLRLSSSLCLHTHQQLGTDAFGGHVVQPLYDNGVCRDERRRRRAASHSTHARLCSTGLEHTPGERIWTTFHPKTFRMRHFSSSVIIFFMLLLPWNQLQRAFVMGIECVSLKKLPADSSEGSPLARQLPDPRSRLRSVG